MPASQVDQSSKLCCVHSNFVQDPASRSIIKHFTMCEDEDFTMEEDDGWLFEADDIPRPIDHGTPIGAGSEDEMQMINVTLENAFTRHQRHTGDYVQCDQSLSMGHFIGIAKRHLTVQESRIAFIIGNESLNADMISAKVFGLKVVLLHDDNCNIAV